MDWTAGGDAPGVMHINSATFSYVDGHAVHERWINMPTLAFAAAAMRGALAEPPPFNETPDDIQFVAAGYASTLNP